ncbi:hypothetical protein BLA29_005309, partial [Euroglyphus maynei]
MVATKVPFHAKVSVTPDLATKSGESVLDNATFVVKNQEVPLVLVDQQKSSAVAAPTTTFTKTTNADQSSTLQQKTENKQQTQAKFKQSLAEMLGGNVESNSGEQQSRISPDSVFLDDPGRMSTVNESSAPISPSYFLAPASAFDRSTKDSSPSDIPLDEVPRVSQQDISSFQTDSKIKDEKTVVDDEVKVTSSAKNEMESSVVTTSAIISSSTTLTSESTSMVKTSVDTSSATSSQRSNSFYVIKHDYSQELPDHILDDDDEEDGDDDSDADDYGFYSSRPSHFLSGSIGSIGGSGGICSSSVSKSSLSTNDNNQNKGKNPSPEFEKLGKTANVTEKSTTKSMEDSNAEVKSSVQTESESTSKQSSAVKGSQQIDQQQKSVMMMINGDVSSQESSSTSIDSDNEKPLIKPSTQPSIVSLSTTVSSSVASKSFPLATTVNTLATNESIQTKDLTNISSGIVINELDDTKVLKMPISSPSSLKPDISNS